MSEVINGGEGNHFFFSLSQDIREPKVMNDKNSPMSLSELYNKQHTHRFLVIWSQQTRLSLSL